MSSQRIASEGHNPGRTPQDAPGKASQHPGLYILWDESQIWGLLAWRGAQSLGLPYRLVRAEEIRQGLLAGKPPAMLLVPGGTARLKSEALGPQGMRAIRDYVAGGGHYLGICGGAGLGLTPAPGKEDDGLGLCPWSRGAYTDRIQHLMSGHLGVKLAQPGHSLNGPEEALADEEQPLLPVWWPGRFSPEPAEGASALAGSATVLAVYSGAPGEDFWLSDLPTRLLPKDAYTDWQNLYGVSLSPSFLEGQPCLVHGAYGAGSYTLSYSHLETPDSPFANAWLAKLARLVGGLSPTAEKVPAWRLDEQPVVWADSGLLACRHMVRGLIDTGLEHGLLFRRNDWLYGWRAGVPGLQLTSLYAALASIISLPPGRSAEAAWSVCQDDLLRKMEIFSQGANNYLLAERLAMTLARSAPEALSGRLLTRQKEALFGERMRPGGLYKEITDVVDKLIWLQIEE